MCKGNQQFLQGLYKAEKLLVFKLISNSKKWFITNSCLCMILKNVKFWQRVRKNQVTDYQCFILTKTLYIPSTKPMWMNLCYNIVTRDVQLTS